MGRHKKNKIKFTDQYEVHNIDGDLIDLIQTDKRTRNAINEIHRQNFNRADSFMDLKFYLERELHYIKRYLDIVMDPSQYKYLQKEQSHALYELCCSMKILLETIRHFPENIWIKIDSLPNTKIDKKIISEWIFNVVNGRMKPLNEEQVLRLKAEHPNYIIEDYRPLHDFLYKEAMKRKDLEHYKSFDLLTEPRTNKESRLRYYAQEIQEKPTSIIDPYRNYPDDYLNVPIGCEPPKLTNPYTNFNKDN